METEPIARRLMGPEGSEVTLGLIRMEHGQETRTTVKITRIAIFKEKKGFSIPNSSFGGLDNGLDLAAVLSNMRADSRPPGDEIDITNSFAFMSQRMSPEKAASARPKVIEAGQGSFVRMDDSMASPPKMPDSSPRKAPAVSRWSTVKNDRNSSKSALSESLRDLPKVLPDGPGSFKDYSSRVSSTGKPLSEQSPALNSRPSSSRFFKGDDAPQFGSPGGENLPQGDSAAPSQMHTSGKTPSHPTSVASKMSAVSNKVGASKDLKSILQEGGDLGPALNGLDAVELRQLIEAAKKKLPRKGIVGMEVNKEGPPFHVQSVEDLMDRNYILQGQQGYNNEIVKAGDKLICVDGKSVEHVNISGLHAVLGGEIHSLVELMFERASTLEHYSISVRRHGMREHERKPVSRRKCSKVSFLNLLCTVTIALTFEKNWQRRK